MTLGEIGPAMPGCHFGGQRSARWQSAQPRRCRRFLGCPQVGVNEGTTAAALSVCERAGRGETVS